MFLKQRQMENGKKRRSGRLPSGDGDDDINCRLLGQIPFLLLGKKQKKKYWTSSL